MSDYFLKLYRINAVSIVRNALVLAFVTALRWLVGAPSSV